MKLPNHEQAVVEEPKIVQYLLDPQHPDGAPKARFFLAMGFTRENWGALAEALRRLASDAPVSNQVESRHGRKFVVDGPLDTPSGRVVTVGTVWIINAGEEVPRLVTAYPREEGDQT